MEADGGGCASRWGATTMYKGALGNLALHSLESLELIHWNSCNCTKACMFVDCKREPGLGPTPPTAFVTHLSNHKVLEDDNIFLHFQGENLAPDGMQDSQWRERLYMPTSADGAVLCYHRWLEQFSEGGIVWARQRERRQWASKFELLERRYSHTEHCSSCLNALHAADTLGKLAEVTVLLGVLSISLFPSFAWPLAALTLLSYMMKQACSGLQQQLTVGEYPPPRNQE
ncbi:PTC52 [Symbiodinium necroappetens]|uniref:PTC52 protein n=1 Tax=Symbiodinium necroappetens TaxID=1628268 RepID=A0A813C5C2_9DINO|nr:PTC52 [Symbiodinium necroappetens]